MLNPAIHLQIGSFSNFLVILYLVIVLIGGKYFYSCVNQAQEDWDSFETSWDFQRHPLLPPKGDR